jgi:exoribonuclease R
MYKINIDNRNYKSCTIYLTNSLEPINLNIDPLNYKLFNNDVFNYDNSIVSIIHSSTRIIENIPAVLIIDNNKTYGRVNNDNGKKSKGKLLYRCIPDDCRLPEFLVPYEIKNMNFSKVFNNLYVTINFIEWTSKHPLGKIKEVIGPINELYNFYEYQLYCKSLHSSIQKFNKETNKVFKENNITNETHNAFIENICIKYPEIENRLSEEWNIITIDSIGSSDYDDGFSIKKLNDNQYLVSIYISNVTLWLDTLNLWDSFSRRVSTIYLPDRKRPMLPTILSDCLCSLIENKSRIAFVMDIIVENDVIKDINYVNCLIKVNKNYKYEEKELFSNEDYLMMYKLTKVVSKKYKYLQEVRNSREVVSYWMIFMNYHCAKEFINYKNGLFRSNIINNNNFITDDSNICLPIDVSNFIKSWSSSSSYYVNFETIKESSDYKDILKHDMLSMDSYIHITSPIRRLIDLLNMIKIQKNKNMIMLSDNALKFYDKWINEIDYINISMRAIRKVQIECNMLDMCLNNPEFLEKIYEGYCFDKIERNDGLYQFIVYLPELKLASKITIRSNLNNYEKRNYKLYLFNNESKFKKKIRLQLLDI